MIITYKALQQHSRKSPYALVALGCCVVLALVRSEDALAEGSVSGSLAVKCDIDTLELPCNLGFHSRIKNVLGPNGASAADSFDSEYGNRFARVEWSGSASSGAVKAAVFASTIAPIGTTLSPGELSGGSVESASFDDMIFKNAGTTPKTIKASFTAGGQTASLASVGVGGGKAYANTGGFETATADYTASFRSLDSAGFAGNSIHRTLNDGLPGSAGFLLTFTVRPGDSPWRLLATLNVRATGNAYSDYGHTGILDYIEVPDEVSISSQSGELFRVGNRFVYPAPVPEPGSVLLCALGLGALALRLKRRRTMQLQIGLNV